MLPHNLATTDMKLTNIIITIYYLFINVLAQYMILTASDSVYINMLDMLVLCSHNALKSFVYGYILYTKI